jgi:hypothetical protein
MAQHSWKSSDFIEVKTKMQRYILRIILSNKTAVSSEDSWILNLELVQALGCPAGRCKTKPKRFDWVRLLLEQKQNVSICSQII